MQMRVWLVGFGTVGRWLARALDAQAARLVSRYGVAFVVVGVANARDGFVYAADGLDLGRAVGAGSLAELPGTRRWARAIDGLRATEADVLIEVTQSPAADGEPGYLHMRDALERGIAVVTSNKWPVALHGVELAELARSRGAAFRAESTVMSGTPVLSALVEGLAGAVPIGLRGLLNATANVILTRMADGKSYADALAEAKTAGLAERDPTADVEGHDSVAKLMILSSLVFGRQLQRDEVVCRGLSDLGNAEIRAAAAAGARLKHLATLAYAEPDGQGEVVARVEPALLAVGDPLASIDGTTNAIITRSSPLGEIMITGPGAGPQVAGQGVFSDLIAVAVRAKGPALPRV